MVARSPTTRTTGRKSHTPCNSRSRQHRSQNRSSKLVVRLPDCLSVYCSRTPSHLMTNYAPGSPQSVMFQRRFNRTSPWPRWCHRALCVRPVHEHRVCKMCAGHPNLVSRCWGHQSPTQIPLHTPRRSGRPPMTALTRLCNWSHRWLTPNWLIICSGLA